MTGAHRRDHRVRRRAGRGGPDRRAAGLPALRCTTAAVVVRAGAADPRPRWTFSAGMPAGGPAATRAAPSQVLLPPGASLGWLTPPRSSMPPLWPRPPGAGTRISRPSLGAGRTPSAAGRAGPVTTRTWGGCAARRRGRHGLMPQWTELWRGSPNRLHRRRRYDRVATTYRPRSACTHEPHLPTILRRMARPVGTAGTGSPSRPASPGPDPQFLRSRRDRGP